MAKFSFTGQKRALGKSTRRALRLSRLAIMSERLVRALWPAFTIICFAAALALFGGYAALGAEDHRIAVLTTVALLTLALIWGGVRFQMPSRVLAAERLDASDKSHPLSTLSDSLAAGREDEAAQRVWTDHQRRAERAAAELRAGPPDLRLARFDRWALRLFAPVTVIAGLIGAGEMWSERLSTLFTPQPQVVDTAGTEIARDPVAEAWAIPPAYTGLDTVYLNKLARLNQAIELPQGSELILRVTDLGELPELIGGGLTGFEGFTDFGGSLAEARGVLQETGPVQVSGGGQILGDWNITVIPDAPPRISMTDDPGATVAGALEVRFKALDDYGIDSAWAEIVPLGGLEPGRGLVEEPITFALPLPISGRALEVEDAAVHDLGPHPWTGAWVEMTLFAEDGAGQQSVAGPVTLRLPGRYFTNELARALVEQRREVAMDFEQGSRTLDVLQSVTRRPEAVFEDNHGAYLGVRTAIRRLADGVVADQVSKNAAEVAEYLWLAALSLEDGDMTDALERLRAAEEALRRALESGTDEDIRRAMDELRAAMQEYIQEMIRQALEQGQQQGQQNTPEDGGRQMSQRDLEELLDELQRRAESGLRDQAREMLSELSRMLQNMQPGMQQHGGSGQRSLEALQEMIQQQRDLADRTFDQLRQQRRGGQQGQQGQQGQSLPGEGEGGEQGRGEGLARGEDGRPGSLAAEQEALRRALEELARQLQGNGGDEIDRALDEAARSMGDARDDLQDRAPGEAVEDQMEALDRLNDGAQALAEALTNGQGDTANEGRGRREGRASDLDADPFDRPAGAFGAVDGRDTDVPDQSVLDRARRVLEELRRRSAETGRPRLELDYLQRLLEQF